MRSYIAIGMSTDTTGFRSAHRDQFDANRAFIQWAGFTFGRAQSFFDFFSQAARRRTWASPATPTPATAARTCSPIPRSSVMASRPVSRPNSRRQTQIVGQASAATVLVSQSGFTAAGTHQWRIVVAD